MTTSIARSAPGHQVGGAPLAGSTEPVPVGLPRQLLRFAAVGIASTLAYIALYALLRTGTGAQVANLLALLVTAVANTAANRRLTFGITGRQHAARHHLQGLAVFALGVALTSGALAALPRLVAHPPRAVGLSVLIGANLVATVMRFVLLRIWLFHRRPTGEDRQPAG